MDEEAYREMYSHERIQIVILLYAKEKKLSHHPMIFGHQTFLLVK